MMNLRAFPAQTIGPFFHFALTTNSSLGCLAGPLTKGERITLRLRLLDGDHVPVTDGMLEIWQADASGIYNHPCDPRYELRDPHFTGFGRLATSPDGECLFETVLPGLAYISLTVFARGLLGSLTTRIYFAGDPAIAEDIVAAMIPEERRRTVVAQPDPERPNQWNLDIHLQGENETVFFDF